MKKIYTSIAFSCLASMGMYAQTITSTNPSGPNMCDGFANFNPGTITAWTWKKDSIIVQQNGTLLDSLCTGNYFLSYNSPNGNKVLPFNMVVATTTNTTTPNPGPTTNNRVKVIGNSAANVCDGSATFDQKGSTAWKWYKDTVVIQTGGLTIGNLCSGNYSIKFLDSAGVNYVSNQFGINVAPAGSGTGTVTPNPGPVGSRVQTMAASSAAVCDGSATFNQKGSTAWKWYKDTTVIQTGGLTLGKLCASNNYSIKFLDSAGVNYVTNQFGIVVSTAPTGSVTPNPTPNPGPPAGSRVQTMATSSSAACDGSATFDQRGSTAWKWYKDTTVIQTGGLTLGKLCASNNYSIKFSDSAGVNYVTNQFGIVVSTATTNTTTPNPGSGGGGLSTGNCPGFEGGATTTNASSAAACDGTAEIVIAKGGTAPFTFLWVNSNVTTKSRTGLCGGKYKFKVTDSKSCYFYDSVEVAVFNSANPCASFKAHVLPHNESVPGACDGSAEALPDGGTAPYTYSWIKSNVVTKVHPNLCSGMHAVKIIDANGCAGVDSTFVGANAANTKPCQFFGVHTMVLNDTANSTANTCGGYVEAICKGGKGAIKYKWSNSAGNTTPYLKGVCEGKYTVTVSDTAGCSATVTAYVGKIQPPVMMPPVPGVMPLHIFVKTQDVTNAAKCNGKAYAKAEGGVAPYTFSFAGATANGDYYHNDTLCAGFYNIDVKDANGATATFVFVIGSPATTFMPPKPVFVNQPIKDTLVATAVSTCVIDYDAIDSIRITGKTFVPGDSLKAMWTVYQKGGGSHQFDQFYHISATGIFNCVLNLFCTNRASGSAKAEDQIYVDLALAIKDNGTSSAVIKTSIYPNPFKDQLNVVIDKNSTITMFDVTGRVVYSEAANAGVVAINTEQFNSGIYILNIKNAQSVITRKVIKQ